MPHNRDPLQGRKPDGSGHARAGWRLEEAEARFSEVVRRARSEGPQHVSVRGRDAVVVVAADDFERLLPPTASPFAVRGIYGKSVWRRA